MIARAILSLLAAYKRWLSPLLPPVCRFTPTCSEYAAEAICVHGVAYGALLAAWRILRCHPLARAGHDPVPVPGRTALARNAKLEIRNF